MGWNFNQRTEKLAQNCAIVATHTKHARIYLPAWTEVAPLNNGHSKMKRFHFDELGRAPLIIDAIYEGGSEKNVKDDPISRLLPGTGNLGGFRVASQAKLGCTYFQRRKCPAYVVLYTSKEEIEWPDYLDHTTGQFTYYGDNREPGHELPSDRKGRESIT